MNKPGIVVANWVHSEIIGYLGEHGWVDANLSREPWSRQQLIEHCQGAVALMGFMTEHVDDAFLEACPSLRMIACALKGYDNYDVDACRKRGVAISFVPDLLTNPTAELTVGLMIALGRNVVASDRFVRTGAFAGWRPTFYGAGLDGSTVGIVGMGAVGRAIAARLQGFGCRILYHDAKPKLDDMDPRWNAQPVTLQKLLADSDYVVVVLPLASGAEHFLDRSAIASMKPGALLINTGRGSVVDEEAVADALGAGHLGGYAADVFEMEDWARANRPRAIPARLLAAADRTLLTSHIGSAVDRVRFEIAREAALNIVQFLAGTRPRGALLWPEPAVEC